MYWRAFDKSEDLDGKIGTVSRLTELYLQRNQLDRLFTRLLHQEREAAAPGAAQGKSRDVAVCMAQAYASSGDLGSALRGARAAPGERHSGHAAAAAALEAGRGGGRSDNGGTLSETAERAGSFG